MRILSLLLAVLLLVGCATTHTDPTTAPEESGAVQATVAPETIPATAELTEKALSEIKTLGSSPDDNYRTWYEIFVYSFCDSNGDGTLADFENLLSECEKRGIKVITDLVLNHTGDDHEWFLTACEYLKNLPEGAEPDAEECPYVDYYFFNREGGAGYHTVPGSGWYYEGQFSPDMPDLNLANEAYSGSNENYIDAPFLSNHDVGRIAGFVNRDENKMKLAGAMNIFMSGSCFIYSGEELGMLGSGNDPSKRAPMYWNAARDDGTTDPPPECELPEEYPCGSLEEQAGEDSSIYNYYRQAIAIRNALPVISHGDTTSEEALNVNCISAQRKTWGEEECIILMNIQDAATVDLSAYADWSLAASLSADGNSVTQDGAALSMPAYGVAVLLPNT